jgi:hypothetical protein
MKKDTREGMGLTVGVDLGDRWSRYCVLDPQGQILEEDTIATTGPAFRKLFGDRRSARVVIEVGTHTPPGFNVCCTNSGTRRSRQIPDTSA